MAKDDGGPAFARSYSQFANGEQAWEQDGMSLRDWFAGQAMQGIVSSIDSEDNYRRLKGHAASDGLTVSQWIARDAYKQADAMIAGREDPNGR